MKTPFVLFSCSIIFHSVLCESCGPISIEDVDFLLIKNGYQSNVRVKLNETESLIDSDDFRLENPTVIYAFDFLENHESISTQTIVDAYLLRGDHNILILDYGKLSGGNYVFDAVPNAIKVRK